MGSLLGEHTKWVLFYGNILGTEKWVFFYGNRPNGFSSMGTDQMGSLLWEQTKWVLS
jgi:hypothetical protein